MSGEFSRSDKEFRKYFKMSKDSFRRLPTTLKPYAGMFIEGSDITVSLDLGITLRYLAGSKVDDIVRIFHVATSTVYTCVWTSCEAINATLGEAPDYTDTVLA